MDRLLFLGTGPAGGNLKPSGKSRRLESSALLETSSGILLFEVTQFFREQCARITAVDAVLITHGHRDACGGIRDLDHWVKKTTFVYTLPQTIHRIKEFYHADHLAFHPIYPYQMFTVCGLHITPIPVAHSLQQGFPTVGYFVKGQDYSFAWVTDIARWDKKAERFMKLADTLIIDTSIWEGHMPSHIQIQEMLPTFCSWKNKRLVLTHIGKTAPAHNTFVKKVSHICPKATAAYDGMTLTL